MDLKWWIIITACITYFEYGTMFFIYFIIALLSMAFGYIFLGKKSPDYLQFISCQYSKGLWKFAERLGKKPLGKVEKCISGSSALDNVLNEIFDFVIRDYIDSWYYTMSSNEEFPHELRKALQKLASNISERFREVDWIPFLTEELPDDFGSHIRLYRRTLDRVKDANKADLEKLFFDLEVEMEKTICREHICNSREAEQEHLRQLADTLMYLLLPEDEFKDKPLRYLVREILVNSIFLPTIDLLSDPDYINQCIVWMCKDNSYTSEYFTHALRMSDTPDELEAVISQIDSFTTPLLGKDTGGEHDALIKAQLGSLTYVKKLCAARIEKMKQGSLDKPDLLAKFLIVPGQKMYNMAFNEVLTKDISVGAFLEFLCTIDCHHYLHMYLNVDGYRCTAKLHLASSSDEEDMSTAARDDLRRFALSIYEEISKRATLDPRLDEAVLKRTLHRIQMEPPNETTFGELEDLLLEILQEDRCFGEFKRSRFYVELLAELDLLREGSQISEEDIAGDREDTRSRTTVSSGGSEDDSLSLQDARANSPRPPRKEYLTAAVSKIEISREGRETFAMYVLCVTRMVSNEAVETWETHRRFSQFDDLHNLILNECGRIPLLKLPVKKTFNNMNREFLEKRRKDLDEYLQILLNPELQPRFPTLKNLVYEFLQPAALEKRKSVTRVSSLLMNPVLTMLQTGSDNFMEGFSRIVSGRNASPARGIRFGSAESEDTLDSGKVANGLDQADAENIPLRILFLLMDEVFDLRHKNQFVRRGIFSILRKIVKAFFGIKVNKLITEKASKLTSAAQLAVFAQTLRDNWWPGGRTAAPKTPRDQATKMRTRVLCRTKMLGSIAEEVSQFLGNETTRQGVQRVFTLVQCVNLNRRFVHVVFEGCLRQAFAGNNIKQFFERQHCPGDQGRSCTGERNSNGHLSMPVCGTLTRSRSADSMNVVRRANSPAPSTLKRY